MKRILEPEASFDASPVPKGADQEENARTKEIPEDSPEPQVSEVPSAMGKGGDNKERIKKKL